MLRLKRIFLGVSKKINVTISIFLILLIAACSRSPLAPTEVKDYNQPQEKSLSKNEYGRYIIRFKQETIKAANMSPMAFSQKYSLTPEVLYSNIFRGMSAVLTQSQADAIRKDAGVKSVEPDLIIYALAQKLPWGIKNIGADVSTARAGNKTGTVSGVRIYILDTGIKSNHPDLNVRWGINYTSKKKGAWNDDHGHGTHCAGIAAARDNKSHVVGAAPGAPLYAVKVLSKNGSGYMSWIISGIDTVIGTKIKNPNIPMVINMSLGAYAGSSAYNSLDIAVKSAVEHGIVVCLAAGNSASDAVNYTPAHTAEAITVGAYDSTNRFAYFSNYGSIVDINAPGVNVLSTYIRGNLMKIMSGTSMAAPHVTGCAAFYMSRHPTATPADVRNDLVANGKATVAAITNSSTTNLALWEGAY